MCNVKSQILIADDNLYDIELTMAALQEHKITQSIDIVRDGEEAIEYLLKKGRYQDRTSPHPALVLLDIKMIKVDGIEVLKVVKQEETLASMPIVILTSSNLDTDMEASYRFGVNAYLIKPSHFGDFVDMMKKLIVFFGLL